MIANPPSPLVHDLRGEQASYPHIVHMWTDRCVVAPIDVPIEAAMWAPGASHSAVYHHGWW